MKCWFLAALTILLALPAYAGTITGPMQGPSGIPVRNATLSFQLQQAGLIVGTGAVVPTTAQCWTSTDGSVVGLPNPLVSPVAAVNYGSGTLPAGIYYLVYTFVNSAGESLPSPELRIQLTSAGSLIVSAPITVPAAATGMNVYIGTTSGGETLQGAQGPTSAYTQGSPLSTGAIPPTTNSAPCTIAFNDTIIPYSGYNVSLTSQAGNAYPGYPQAWQLNGGLSGTINISSGAPLWNGTVVYPMPILSQPLNHGPQSISGPLDFGGYNLTDIGNFTASSSNTVLNPAQCGSLTAPSWCAGTEIGAWTVSALAACGAQCKVEVPAGTYTQTTQIVVPLNTPATYWLDFDQGAVVSWAGTGCAITTSVVNAPGSSQLLVSGGHFIATGPATCGIQVQPTNGFTIRGMNFAGFPTAGIWIHGANGGTVEGNFVSNSGIGVYLSPTFCNGATCGDTVSGGAFTPNNVKVLNNILPENGWGIQSADPITATLSGALGDVVAGNDVENETIGSISWGRGHGTFIGPGNYVEASPIGIQLGISAGSAFFACEGCSIAGNYFTETTGMVDAISLLNAKDTMIYGNSEQFVSANSSNCFINALPFSTGTSGGEQGTVIGPNHLELGGEANYLCQSGAGVIALNGAGSYTQQNQNYFPLLCSSNYAITSSGTSDTNVPCSGNVTTASQCFVTPNGAVAVAAMPSYYFPSGNNTGTLQHPASVVGKEVNIWCSGVLN